MSMESSNAAPANRAVRTGIAATALTVLLGAGTLFALESCAGDGKGPPKGPIESTSPPSTPETPETPETPPPPDQPDPPVAPPEHPEPPVT